MVGLLVLAACAAGPTATPPPTRLRIAGSTTMAPALGELAATLQAQNPNLLVEVQGGGTQIGWDELRAGRVDVAALSYWDETQVVPDEFQLVPIARDGVAVVVHPRNPISNVTALQLRALFGGEVLDWRALGGIEGEPQIVSREDGSGTRAAFEARVMGGQRVTLNALVMPTTQAVIDYVASHPLSVGYVSASAADSRVRIVPVEGLPPSTEDIRSGAYYLARTLYLGARAPLTPQVRALVDFVASPAGQEVVAGRFAVLP
ncbi:MAG: phosphate ABC transporter substrate-binding protein [Anaerolineae bacterium]|jgi:phosphate transport system substrate-binding protein|nr:phosphate ABC transporter substrate-binding protein [Anaerolineae bacterium]